MSTSRRKVVAINLVLLLLVLAAFEVAVRYYVRYNPTYYSGIRVKGDCVKYPYGTYCFNSHGYPDEEFNLQSNRPRIGYVGDSVCFGMGAGQEQRITTLLKHAYPDFEHWNFCKAAHDVMSGEGLATILEITEQFQLSHLVYMMNLNDIAPTVDVPDADAPEAGQSALVIVKKILKPVDYVLRGRSYLYSHLRSMVKERLIVAGYEHTGYQAIELYPGEHDDALVQFAEHINELARRLFDRDIKFTMVMLPYEMQVSAHAADTYRNAGIRWEPAFLSGRTQHRIAENLAESISWFDVLPAFDQLPPTATGEYFVYDKGDKLDWNHPNLKGHRQIADYLIAQGIFSPR